MLRSKPLKEQKCSYCGKIGHTSFRCPKKAIDKHKKATTRHSKPLGGVQKKKMYNLLTQRQMSRSELIQRLDTICSKIVRQNGSKDGYNYCYTCGVRLPWNSLDCGHFISRRFISTRFDLNNMRPQCQWCNRELHGNLDVYREKLTNELGEEKMAELHRQTYQKLSDLIS